MPQKTAADIQTEIDTNFADNLTGDITPLDAREVFDDLLDSKSHYDHTHTELPVKTTTPLVSGVATVVQSTLVSAGAGATWDLSIKNSVTGVNDRYTVIAEHDALLGVDATAVRPTMWGLPDSGGHSYDVTLTGTGASQAINLVVTASGADFTATVSTTVL